MSGEILKIKDLFPDQSDSPFDKNTWRRVREQGRLLMDDKDDGPVRGWGLFQEYARRCEVAVYKDDLGHRQMVIVDPEVGSRRDRYVSCQDQFRKTFLLFLNLAEAKRHSLGDPDAAISVRDLERIYPGMTMGQLGGMLRERLSSIRYGKIFCEKKPRIDVDSVGGGVKRGGGGEMAVVANNTADIRAEKRKKRSRGTIIRVVAAAGVVSVVTSACARAIVPLPTSAETTAPISSTVPATDPGETIEPRVTPTEFSPQVTPTYAVEAAGGPYTEVQLALNNSQSAINQKVIIERWLAYWANFDNRPFDPTSVQLKWKYIYDSNNPANVLVMLEAGGEYNGRLFMGPIGADGKFAEFPPEVSGTDIGVGYGPLELTAGADGQILSVDSDGIPVRRDGNGNIVEKLNMKTKQWEGVDIKTERERVIVNQINNFLSSSGGYSDDELAEKIFVMGNAKYGEGQTDYKDDLGLMMVSSNIATVQGINLGSVEGDNCVWMFFGTKMGEDGKRVVVPVRIPLESIEYRVPIIISFYNQRDIAPVSSQSNIILLKDQQIDLRTAPEIVDNLNDDLLGKPMLLSMWYNYPGDLSNDLSGVVRSNGGSDDDVRLVTKLFSDMEAIQARSFCDFYSVADGLLKNHDCQGEYLGPVIDSKIEKIDKDWYVNPESLSITILLSYRDN